MKDKQVIDDFRPLIKDLLDSGMSQTELATHLGVTAGTIWQSQNVDRPYMPGHLLGEKILAAHKRLAA